MGFVDRLTGKTAANASKAAGKMQQQSAMEASEMIGATGQQALRDIQGAPFQQIQSLINPQNQMSFLQGNPMFQAALGSSNEQMKRMAAATGKFNTGGMVNSLFQNYLAQGNDFLNQQLNRAAMAQGLNQNLANTRMGITGTQADLMTGGTAALAAGKVGAANARTQGAQGLLGAAVTGAALSDRRLKNAIEKHDVGVNGLSRYKFKYNGSNDEMLGYMADEVLAVDPEHVFTHETGYLMVSEKYKPVRLH